MCGLGSPTNSFPAFLKIPRKIIAQQSQTCEPAVPALLKLSRLKATTHCLVTSHGQSIERPDEHDLTKTALNQSFQFARILQAASMLQRSWWTAGSGGQPAGGCQANPGAGRGAQHLGQDMQCILPPSSGCSKKLMRKGTLVKTGREVLLDRIHHHHIRLTLVYNHNLKN